MHSAVLQDEFIIGRIYEKGGPFHNSDIVLSSVRVI